MVHIGNGRRYTMLCISPLELAVVRVIVDGEVEVFVGVDVDVDIDVDRLHC